LQFGHKYRCFLAILPCFWRCKCPHFGHFFESFLKKNYFLWLVKRQCLFFYILRKFLFSFFNFMSILPSIFGFLLLLSVEMPMITNISGFGLLSTPSLVSRQSTNCSVAQKDSYGRCSPSLTAPIFATLAREVGLVEEVAVNSWENWQSRKILKTKS